eukprot:5082101-Amphidinium_carterae.1
MERRRDHLQGAVGLQNWLFFDDHSFLICTSFGGGRSMGGVSSCCRTSEDKDTGKVANTSLA